MHKKTNLFSMMRTGLATALISVLLVCNFTSTGKASQETPFLLEFIYIDATEGEAAAGHSAIKLGTTIFHYQFHSNGLLLLSKQEWDDFRYYYNDLSNRTLTIRSIEIDEPTFHKILESFQQQYVQQEIELARLVSLQEQAQLLRKLSHGENTLEIEGIGLFSQNSGTDSTLSKLITTKLSKDFLVDLDRSIEKKISLSVQNLPHVPPRHVAISKRNILEIDRLKGLLTYREALAILLNQRGLLFENIIQPDDANRLNEGQREELILFQKQVLASIIGLLQTKELNLGQILLVQIARYMALERSLAENKIMTLYPYRAVLKQGEGYVQVDRDVYRYLFDEAQYFKDKTFQTFFDVAPSLKNIAYSMLEKAQGHLHLFNQSPAELKSLPDFSNFECSLPCRPGKVNLVSDETTKEHITEENIVEHQSLEDEYARYLSQKYGYGLYSKNCATELARTINASLGSKKESIEQLGGYIEPGTGLSYVPFGLDDEVAAKYNVTDTVKMEAYRLRKMHKLSIQKPVYVWLRESNTLTSTLYTPWEKDAYFLFFTDDTVIIRPLLGMVNVGYGLIHTVGGLLTAPFDKGKHFMRGLNGVVFSFPELLFFNIRKGSYQIIVLEE